MLALVALKARDRILERNRELVREHVVTLEGLFDEFPGLVEWDRPLGGCVAFPRYLGPDGVEAFCRSLLEERGVLLLPSSIYASDLTPVPTDFFRIGFGRTRGFEDGLAAMRAHFRVHYPAFAA